jgi:hypothetical protein
MAADRRIGRNNSAYRRVIILKGLIIQVPYTYALHCFICKRSQGADTFVAFSLNPPPSRLSCSAAFSATTHVLTHFLTHPAVSKQQQLYYPYRHPWKEICFRRSATSCTPLNSFVVECRITSTMAWTPLSASKTSFFPPPTSRAS